METLSLDFNRADREGRVRIGPVALYRHQEVLQRIALGDRVLVTDGNDCCEGIFERGTMVEYGGELGYVVRLDMTTWRDGPGTGSRSTPAPLAPPSPPPTAA